MPSWFWLALVAIAFVFVVFCFAMAFMANHLANKLEAEAKKLEEAEARRVHGYNK